MRHSKLLASLVAIVAVLWILSGLLFSDSSAVPSLTSESNISTIAQVRVKKITAENFTREILVTGRSQASRHVTMKAEINGQIKVIAKEKGDHVMANDIIAEMEIRDRAANVTQSRQRVNQRKIEYNAAKSLETKGFNSKIRLAQSRADLETARAALTLAEVDLAKTKITAPFDGIIQEQYIELGDYLDQNNEIVKIVDLDPIELVGFVSEQNILSVQNGVDASVEFLNGTSANGTVSYISPAADINTRTFRIEISLDNEDLSIKDGLTAKIKIPVVPQPAHKISPSILTLRDNGQIGVKIVTSENKVQFVPITILSDKPDFMWISGLPNTVNIITVGQDFVRDNQLVSPVSSDEEDLL